MIAGIQTPRYPTGAALSVFAVRHRSDFGQHLCSRCRFTYPGVRAVAVPVGVEIG